MFVAIPFYSSILNFNLHIGVVNLASLLVGSMDKALDGNLLLLNSLLDGSLTKRSLYGV